MIDVIVIGGGVNGLTAAAFLAKAGLKAVVLERRAQTGGAARVSHAASIDPAIVRALSLDRRGLQIVRSDVDVCALGSGRPLVLWHDARRAADQLRAQSAHDAERYPAFLDSFARISRVLRAVCAATPPSVDDPSAGDVIELLKTGRAFRALGRTDAHRLLRWLPMAVADFAAEWFDSEPLRATIAGGGILGSFLGPWSAGSTAVLLLLGASEGHPFATGWFARGGTGAVVDALGDAARSAGAEIRTNADVARVDVNDDGTATGVTLANGEQLSARAVVSNLDPRRTLLGLVDPIHLGPDLVRRVQNIRGHGTLAHVSFTVGALPRFTGADPDALRGRIRLARNIDAIERAFDAAKYGGFSDEPWIELTIPTFVDPSLAPADQHRVSAYVQYAPYVLRGTNWDAERDRLGEVTARVVDQYAPGFSASVIAREVVTPLDLERMYGMTGGHIFHGELALDQLFVARPLLGWAKYDTPVRNLYLCGSGTHPGNGLTGRSGAMAAQHVRRRLRR